MSNSIIKLFTLFLAIGFLTACNKDDDDPKQEVNKEDFLIGKDWTLTDLQTEPAIQGIDPLSFLEACYVDNIYRFLDGGVLEVDEGAEKCEENGPQEHTGTWNLDQNQENLTLAYDNLEQEFEIVELSNSIMKLRSFVTYQGFSAVGIFTFTPN